MAHNSHPEKMPELEKFRGHETAKLMLLMLAVGGLSLLICLIGLFFNAEQLAFSWLYSLTFCLTICLGALFWVLIHHATNAGWSVVIRRQFENVASLLPLLAILFIPIIFFASRYLYGWMMIEPANDALLKEKQPYLSQWFFWLRAIFYWALFCFMAWRLRQWSQQQDKTGEPRLTLKMRHTTYGFVPLFALSLTFMAFDWLMSLDFVWFSTMWGVYIFAGSALSGIATAIIIFTLLRRAGYLKEVLTLEHFHLMGKLLLTFVIFWAYIGFSQYMLIWYANIPEETIYFFRRNTGGWNTLSIIMVIGHFFIPFLLLLNRPIKKRPMHLSLVSVWILIMHWLDHYIIVMPMLHKEGPAFHIFDLFALTAMIALLGFFFLRKMTTVSLFPAKDPRIIESITVTN